LAGQVNYACAYVVLRFGPTRTPLTSTDTAQSVFICLPAQ